MLIKSWHCGNPRFKLSTSIGKNSSPYVSCRNHQCIYTIRSQLEPHTITIVLSRDCHLDLTKRPFNSRAKWFAQARKVLTGSLARREIWSTYVIQGTCAYLTLSSAFQSLSSFLSFRFLRSLPHGKEYDHPPDVLSGAACLLALTKWPGSAMYKTQQGAVGVRIGLIKFLSDW
jgi:hypothetical protein